MAVDPRRVAVLEAGKIGESLLSGLLSDGSRARTIVVTGRRRSASPSCASARRGGDDLEHGGRRRGRVRRRRREAPGLRRAAGRGRRAARPRPDRVVGGGGDPDRRDRGARVAVGVPVVRAMPNAPSTVHEGIAGICGGAHADDAHLTIAEEALSHLGPVVRVAGVMDAVAIRLGAGLLRAVRRGDDRPEILLGLSPSPRSSSSRPCSAPRSCCATSTCIRSSCAEMVTSPGGTTIRAIRSWSGRASGRHPERHPGGHGALREPPPGRGHAAATGFTRTGAVARRDPAPGPPMPLATGSGVVSLVRQ